MKFATAIIIKLTFEFGWCSVTTLEGKNGKIDGNRNFLLSEVKCLTNSSSEKITGMSFKNNLL